jgi:hypothetical protein
LIEGRVRQQLVQEFTDAVESQSSKILREVGLSATLASAGITEVLRQPPDWSALVENAADIVLLPEKLVRLEHEWAAALDVARARPVAIDVHIPSDATPEIDALAARLQEDAARITELLHDLPTRIVEQWEKSGPRSGGQLRVLTYDGVPGFGLVRADVRVAVLVPAMAGPRPPGRALAFVFNAEAADFMDTWIADQLSSIDSREFDVQRA